MRRLELFTGLGQGVGYRHSIVGRADFDQERERWRVGLNIMREET